MSNISRYWGEKILYAVLRPFRENLGLFIAVLWCSVAAVIIPDYINGCPLKSAIYILKIGVITSYVAVLIAGLCKGKGFIIAKCILLSLAFLNLIADVVSQMTCGCRFDITVVDLIGQTNISETGEFIQSYISAGVIFWIAAYISVPILVLWLWKRIDRIPKPFHVSWLLLGLLYCFLFTDLNTPVSNCIFLNKIHFVTHPVPYIDLKEYAHEPELTVTDEGIPNIIVIIGESLSKSHCSLYSYEKDTYPRLAKLNPIVFGNVSACDRATNSSFKGILNTYRIGDDTEEWYEATTVFDIAKAMGYKTRWLSNQMRYGLTGNIVTDYAMLADDAEWVVAIDNYSSVTSVHLDEEILPRLQEFETCKNLHFIHLMGSHEHFSARYPPSFEIFKADDYPHRPEQQRQLVAQYDNALLYNDYIVSEIIGKYMNDDCLVFYFPDHGIDVFESSASFCGHALTNNAASMEAALRIPFIAVYSDTCMGKHPELISRLLAQKDVPFRSDAFIYLLAETMGIIEINGKGNCLKH